MADPTQEGGTEGNPDGTPSMQEESLALVKSLGDDRERTLEDK